MTVSSASPRVRLGATFAASLAIAIATFVNLRFVLATGERSAFVPRMTADAESYLRNARAIIADGEWLFTPDTYHSVGGSLYVAAVLRIFGSVLAIKVLHVAWLALALALFHRVAERALESPRAAAACTVLLSGSALLARYCGVVQYEIVVLFLFVVVLALASSEKPRPFALGVFGALAATFRVHFGVFVLFYVLDALRSVHIEPEAQEAHRRRAALALAGFSLVAVPFNAYYLARIDEAFFFQSASSGAGWLRRLNANATGVMWPYPPRSEPHGWAFVAQEPLAYLRFLARKALFLFGARPDVWFVESRWVWFASRATSIPRWALRPVMAGTLALGTLAGWGAVVARWRGSDPTRRVAAMIVLGVLLPQLVVGSSTRVLVPILPVCAFLVAALFTRVRRG